MLVHLIQHLVQVQVRIVGARVERIFLFHTLQTRLPVRFVPFGADVGGRADHQEIHQRLVVIARSGQVVAGFVGVIDPPADFKFVRHALIHRQGRVQPLETRVGQNPFVFKLGQRQPGRALVGSSLNRDAVGVGDAGLKITRNVVFIGYPGRPFGGLAGGRVGVVLKIRLVVEFGTPGPASRYVGARIGSVGAVQIRIIRVGAAFAVLELVVGIAVDPVDADVGVNRYADAPAFAGTRLGGDNERPASRPATVESRSTRAFQHSHFLDVVGVNVRHRGAVVDRAVLRQVRVVARAGDAAADGHPVHHNQGLVVVEVQRRLAPERNSRRPHRSRPRPLNVQPRHFAAQRVDPVVRFGIFHRVLADGRSGIAERFLFAPDAKGRHDYFVEGLVGGFKLHVMVR